MPLVGFAFTLPPESAVFTDRDTAALLRLLQDRSDPETRELVSTQLRALDVQSLRQVRERAAMASDQVLMEVEAILHARLWGEMAAELPPLTGPTREDLLGSLIFLARFGHPDCRPGFVMGELEAIVERCAAPVAASENVIARADALARVLGQELGFAGNEDDYYSPENSFIDSVLRTRLGIPISLSALYVIVAQRLGVPLRGVGLPGHFIVGLFARDEKAVYYDPFRRGVRLSKLECARLVRQAGFTFEEQAMAPVGTRYILQRMLNNLLVIYTRQGDHERRQAIQRFAEALG